MKVNQTFLCERENLTIYVADLMPICTPSSKETSGMWLEDMADMELAKCTKVPESCSAEVDEMREMVSMIKTKVLAELKGRTK